MENRMNSRLLGLSPSHNERIYVDTYPDRWDGQETRLSYCLDYNGYIACSYYFIPLMIFPPDRIAINLNYPELTVNRYPTKKITNRSLKTGQPSVIENEGLEAG
jgi:hypothetical protein